MIDITAKLITQLCCPLQFNKGLYCRQVGAWIVPGIDYGHSTPNKDRNQETSSLELVPGRYL